MINSLLIPNRLYEAIVFAATLSPTLVGSIFLCASDFKSRMIPRMWVLATLFTQSLSTALYVSVTYFIKQNFSIHSCFNPLLMGWFCCFLTALLYEILRLCAGKNALGFGDVTCAIMLSQAVGFFGLYAYALWFALTGLVGLVCVVLWQLIYVRILKKNSAQDHKLYDTRMPFVPVLTISAILATLFCWY